MTVACRLGSKADNKEKNKASLKSCADLERLARDFTETARTYGRVIISELHLPVEAKTVRPINVGGVLGGSKFVGKESFFAAPSLSVCACAASARRAVQDGHVQQHVCRLPGRHAHCQQGARARAQGEQQQRGSFPPRAERCDVLQGLKVCILASPPRHLTPAMQAYFGWFFNRASVGLVSFPLTAIIDFKVTVSNAEWSQT